MRQSTKNSPAVGIVGVLLPGEGVQAEIEKQISACDLLEFRADGYPVSEIPSALAACTRRYRSSAQPLPLVFTMRLRRDGGFWPDAAASSRVEIWQSLLSQPETSAIAWVDVEVEEIEVLPASLRKQWKERGIGLLLSHHDVRGDESPSDWKAVTDTMTRYAPEGAKLALSAHGEDEILESLALAASVAHEFPASAVFCMGAAGQATRVIAPLLGCALSYAHLGGAPAAPGQLSALETRSLIEALRAETDDGTKLDNLAWLQHARTRLRRAGLAN